MPPRPAPSRIAQALEYLQGLKSGVGEFVGGVGTNLADRARAAGGLAYEALTSDPYMGQMTTAEFSEAAANRAPTPRLDQAAQDIGAIGKAILTRPVQTGKAIVRGEVDRAKEAMTSPQAAGQYAGSFVDPTRLAAALRHRAPIAELDVYHGTPHRFPGTEANPLGEFDASKIGTGEGAQAYGHGVYLAESPKVAENYKKMWESGNRTDSRLTALLDQFDGDVEKAADRFMASVYNTPKVKEKMRKEVIGLLQEKKQASFYKADLPDQMIDRMLDWDKPIREQPTFVQDIARKAIAEKIGWSDPVAKAVDEFYDATGKDLYESLEAMIGSVEASKYFRQSNIPGIRYLDAGSRDGGSGTRNFVVFPGEEKKVRILERK